MAHPIVFLWTTPRSRSTAFERMMVERGDHQVFDEPFSARYYYSPERRSDRFIDELPGSTTTEIVARLHQAAESGPVFVKDMAYQAAGALSAELLNGFVNTFLVRDPVAAIASFAKKWPDLTEEEAGYTSLHEAYDIAVGLDGPPPVIEARDLSTRPPEVIAAWCEAVGIDFLPDALSWEAGMIPQWELWSEWYEGVAASTGFRPADPDPVPPLTDPRLAAIANRARPTYDRLAATRLAPVEH